MGAEFDYGFWLDPRGRMIAQGCYEQLNNGAIEGMKFGIIFALLHAGQKAHARMLKNQTMSQRLFEYIINRNKEFWGRMRYPSSV